MNGGFACAVIDFVRSLALAKHLSIARVVRVKFTDAGTGTLDMADQSASDRSPDHPASPPLRPVRQNIRVNILRAAMLAVLPLVVIVDPAFGDVILFHEGIESVGVLMLIAGVLGRFWATLYIGGVKNREVVQDGPYSTTRNPLYVASAIAATGIGLMVGSISIAVCRRNRHGDPLYDGAEGKRLPRTGIW